MKKKLEALNYNIKKLVKYQTLDMFKEVEIETVAHCNRRCWYCPMSVSPREEGYMREDLFYSIIDQLQEVKFTGCIGLTNHGEPLLDKRLPRFVSYVRKMLPKTFIIIYTNGDYLDTELFNKFKTAGLDKFVVTLHDNKTNGKLLELSTNLSVKDYKMITIRKSKDIKLWNKIGDVNFKGKKVIECYRPQDSVVVEYTGKVILCCNDYYADVVWGNLNTEKLMDVWNKPYYKLERERAIKGFPRNPLCLKCYREGE